MNQPGDPNFDQGSQTNPFTADLKGEFGSNFGTGTNAVSQIFKEGGFAGDQRTKTLLGVGAVVLVAAVAYFVMGTGGEDPYGAYVEDEELSDAGFPEEDDDFDDGGNNAMDEKDKKDDVAASQKDGENSLEDNSNDFDNDFDNSNNFSNENYNAEPSATAVSSAPRLSSRPSVSSLGTSAPVLMAPADGLMRTYDDAMSHPEFTWSGGGGRIAFSRSADMSVIEVEERVRESSHQSRQLSPGQWYWRVENRFGVSDIRSFTILPPMIRNTVLSQPQEGGSLAGNGGVVQWTGSSRVAYYRVELSSGSWANPQYRFSTAGTQLGVEGIQPGQYQLRVGAFSEVSGRFEYTAPIQVSVE
ncbi:MAG: hypothetical protein AB8C84_02905 [Oligoflexales bacterium]